MRLQNLPNAQPNTLAAAFRSVFSFFATLVVIMTLWVIGAAAEGTLQVLACSPCKAFSHWWTFTMLFFNQCCNSLCKSRRYCGRLDLWYCDWKAVAALTGCGVPGPGLHGGDERGSLREAGWQPRSQGVQQGEPS